MVSEEIPDIPRRSQWNTTMARAPIDTLSKQRHNSYLQN